MTNDKQPENKPINQSMIFGFTLGIVLGAVVVIFLIWTGPVTVRDGVILELNNKVIEQARRLDQCKL